MTAFVGGPMFETSRRGMEKVINTERTGAHYSVWYLDSDNGRSDPEIGMESLRKLFPDAKADDMNFVLFSTSGVHGSYTTIEQIEAGLIKYGDDFECGSDEWPDDYAGNTLTVLVVHPRIVCLKCGNVRVRLADIPWLKALRKSSWKAVAGIGA